MAAVNRYQAHVDTSGDLMPWPQAMKKLTFTDSLVATQMHSKEGEIIDFARLPRGVEYRGPEKAS